jgi:hypothetical protein
MGGEVVSAAGKEIDIAFTDGFRKRETISDSDGETFNAVANARYVCNTVAREIRFDPLATEDLTLLGHLSKSHFPKNR